MKVWTRNVLAPAATLLTGVMLAACGASPTDTGGGKPASSGSGNNDLQAVYKAVEGLSGQQRVDKLTQLAKDAGGTVGFYHSGDLKPEAQAFEKATGLKVNDFQATSERVMERVSQEQKANQQGSDVVLGGAADMKHLGDQGGLDDLKSPVTDYVGADYKSGHDVSPIAIMDMPTYNTEQVSADKLPKTWEDLFRNPPGRLGIEITDSPWYETIIRKYFMQQKGMSEADAINLVNNAYRGAQQIDGHTLVANLLASGQMAYVANVYAHYVPGLVKSGAPISYDNLSPTMPPFVETLTAGITKGGKNPAGGLLLLEWLMGPDGQKVIAGQGYVPTSNQYQGGQTLLQKYPNAIVQDLYLTDTDQDNKYWDDKFQALLQFIGGKPASK